VWSKRTSSRILGDTGRGRDNGGRTRGELKGKFAGWISAYRSIAGNKVGRCVKLEDPEVNLRTKVGPRNAHGDEGKRKGEVEVTRSPSVGLLRSDGSDCVMLQHGGIRQLSKKRYRCYAAIILCFVLMRASAWARVMFKRSATV
jgi:hypothetical protein